LKYVDAIRNGFDYLLNKYDDLTILGQGLWSPFYVGRSMNGLDKKYGRSRIIDTPVSENAVTGIALGFSIANGKVVVVHPRMDFMILAADQIVNQIAKWRYVLGSNQELSITIRGIINRGGAQHSQALHSWFAHIPGLRVVMPSTPSDARNLLIQSVESPDPVIFIDDRWCYDLEENIDEKTNLPSLKNESTRILENGSDITLVGVGYTSLQCKNASEKLRNKNISCEVIDTRILSPLNVDQIHSSVVKTRRLLVIDGGWKNSGFASEIITSVMEKGINNMKTKPYRITLPDTPAPSSRILEDIYYPNEELIVKKVSEIVNS
jgi:acetoin:2,6-dichlorophenolindophenol oxidoreductase subunit beta